MFFIGWLARVGGNDFRTHYLVSINSATERFTHTLGCDFVGKSM
jgi:hypothetical protein